MYTKIKSANVKYLTGANLRYIIVFEVTNMEIKLGRYRHFKGNEYEVIGVAKHSETCEEMVVYKALYGDGGLWVRPAKMWDETVERDGKVYKRFTYIDG